NLTPDAVRTLVNRLDIESYKAQIRGLTQFGDRMPGTQRNRDAITWLEARLQRYGYTNVQRHQFMSSSGEVENLYATKIRRTTPDGMYIVSAHMDGRGDGEAADDDGRQRNLRCADGEPVVRQRLSGDDRYEHGGHGFNTVSGSGRLPLSPVQLAENDLLDVL